MFSKNSIFSRVDTNVESDFLELNDSNEDKLRKQETYYDQLYEKYSHLKEISNTGKKTIQIC